MTSLAFAIGCAAARPRRGRGRQCAPLDRHRHHRRHARRDDARDAVRAAALLSLRPDEGRQGGSRTRAAAEPPPPRRRTPTTIGSAGGRLLRSPRPTRDCARHAARARTAALARRLHGRPGLRASPPVDAPKAFIYEAKDAADTANTQWWQQFNDPVLDQLIAEALANNSTSRSPRPTSSRRPACSRRRARSCSRSSATTAARGRARASESTSTPQLSPGYPESAVGLPGAAAARAGRSTCGAASAA